MMKKVLALILVLGMTSLANATVIDVVAVGPGSLGHAGTSDDPLYPSETIEIKIVLNADPNPTWYYGGGVTGYNGYYLSMMDVDLEVSGPGLLSEKGTGLATRMKHHTLFSPWAEPEPAVVNNAIAYLSGIAAGNGIQGPADLVWNLVIHGQGWGEVLVDLTLNGPSQYSDAPDDLWDPPPPWTDLLESDLGDLVLHISPEPMTIALLGLGGLFLRQRR